MSEAITIGELAGCLPSTPQATKPRPTFDVDFSLLSDAQLEALETLPQEESDKYMAQLEREQKARKARLEQNKATIDYFAKIRQRDNAEENRTADWFERMLDQRIVKKQLTKITHDKANVEVYLRYAYMRRVAADNVRLDQLDARTIFHCGKAAEWMISDDAKAGYILRGLPGVGKSTMMRAISDVFAIMERKLTMEVSATDVANAGLNDKKAFREMCEAPMLAIDDLGTEPPTVKSYGNEVSPMVDLLTERHKKLGFTVITTNLVRHDGVDDIRERYGDRLFDRIVELCDGINYGSDMTSFRIINKQRKEKQ